MPIQSADIKLLKSAVMADTTDGGGAMTGSEVVDGQSNNLFPDTSQLDRALGRINFRKVFGVAHTDTTETLLGAHLVITSPPQDPLVHCTLMQTPGWGDTRSLAQEVTEKYLAKGSRISPRLMDTHYAGSLQLRLISPSRNADFPKGGEAIAIVLPDGAEQYVRVTKITFSTQTFYVSEGGSAVEFTGTIGTCDLGGRLTADVPGPPVSRLPPDDDTSYARIYNTTTTAGAQFFGIKPLVADAVVDDIAVLTSGIYTPLVPASTTETPIIDQYPLMARSALSRTAAASVSLPPADLRLQPGTTVRTPTPIEPGSLVLTHGGTVFTDDGGGLLKQGALAVGAVDYRGSSAVFAAGAPDYGVASATLQYRPATPSGAAAYSDHLAVTIANQGLAFVYAFDPPPAPGTLTISYMAQGRWYDLVDNANGKLSGAEGGYGVGQINYNTASASFTLGALPDVGSSIILQWGNAASAQAIALAALPSRISANLPIDLRANPASVSLAWARDGTNYAATANALGELSGDATGRITPGGIAFAPDVFPQGNVTITYTLADQRSSSADYIGAGVWMAAISPVAPSSLGFSLLTVLQAGFDIPVSLRVIDNGRGQLYGAYPGGWADLGTVDYASGQVSVPEFVALNVYETVVQTVTVNFTYDRKVLRTGHLVQLVRSGAQSIGHTGTAGAAATVETVTPQWQIELPLLTGLKLKPDALAFDVGGDLYTSQAGVLRKGWSVALGAPSVASAGAASDTGTVTLSSLPASGTNALTWSNAAQDLASSAMVAQGVFRTASAPLKVGVFQLRSGALIGNANAGGVISGDNWTGSIDFERGIVKWSRTGSSGGWQSWAQNIGVSADSLAYNAVFLQYLPINGALLGLETARLPLDGKVPIYRSGDLQFVHNTEAFTLPNPLVKGVTYNVGRTRVESVKVKTAAGATVDPTLYTTALDAGDIVFPVGADLTGLDQPFQVLHRIADMLPCAVADISGKLTFTTRLTHNYPADRSYVSSVLPIGDVFARSYGGFSQQTWSGQWSDELIGDAPLAQFNTALAPIVVTNRGAITERWAFIFTHTTQFRIVGESVGEIGIGTTGADCSPLNPATGVPYFTVPALGWGAGWAPGYVLRRNTAACGAPVWVVRTVLQGPASVLDDKFTVAFRGDVDRP